MPEFSEETFRVIQGLDDLAHRRLYVRNDNGSYEKILGYGMLDPEYVCYCALLEKRHNKGSYNGPEKRSTERT